MLRVRYLKITGFFARIILQIFFYDILLLKLGFRKYAARTRPSRLQKIAQRYRKLAIEMGGVLIKVGQFLSTRVDVLPEEITSELSGLQDEVPAESYEDIRRVAEEDLGESLLTAFRSFESRPIASASLGQVHQAYLWSENDLSESEVGLTEKNKGIDEVVVKVQRPGIEKIIEIDLNALRTVGSWLQLYPPIRRRANIPALIAEFTRVLYEEIDYLAEGRNIEIFSSNFITDRQVRVPKVIWTLTTRRVLTMEDVRGIKIDNYNDITEAGIDRNEVAVKILNVYFKQIFEDGFFHADPHPGNLFVRRTRHGGIENSWEITFVDFGMVGRITPAVKKSLVDILVAFATRDSTKLTHAYQEMDILLPGADLDLIAQADNAAFDLVWGKSMSELKDISPSQVREMLFDFRELLYKMPFQVPHDLLFLGRAIGLLSGLCTGLDPEFNVWDQIVPYAKKFLSEEKGDFFQDLLSGKRPELITEIGEILHKLISVPGLTYSILEKVDQGKLTVRNPKLEDQLNQSILSQRRLAVSVVFSAFLLSSVLLYINQDWQLAILSGGCATITFLWLTLSARR